MYTRCKYIRIFYYHPLNKGFLLHLLLGAFEIHYDPRVGIINNINNSLVEALELLLRNFEAGSEV